MEPAETYPRPDFWRPGLQWTPLNGTWDLLFDDEDVGLLDGWAYKGIPDSATVHGSSSEVAEASLESQRITAGIVGSTQRLTQGNLDRRELERKTNRKRSITVPYVFQCPASGINERAVHEVLWYERQIQDIRTTENGGKKSRLVLRFGAVDYEAKAWVGGHHVGTHTGGHVPFDIDITDAVEAQEQQSYRLTLRVYDSAYDLTQPRGKQYWGAKPESIFYTPSSGIWQSVWLESLPAVRIGDSNLGTIFRNDDIDTGMLHATIAVIGRRLGHKYSVDVEAHYNGVHVTKTERRPVPNETNEVSMNVNLRMTSEQLASLPGGTDPNFITNRSRWREGLALWSPEYPHLYALTIRLYNPENEVIDELRTTTGMRSLDWTMNDGTFKINGQAVFQALCLDQGYWPETFMTPPSPSAVRTDIELAKRMGFNGCRKHQKVEDPLFLYWADRLGYLVWGEMANAYSFSNSYVSRFNREWMEAVRRDINHPCIVTWTPVNESWAYTDLQNSLEQRNHIRSLYYMTKTLDPSRPINDNCGWEHVKTDVTTFHDYSDSPALADTCAALNKILSPKAGRPLFVSSIRDQHGPLEPGAEHEYGSPIICTEFGGVNIAQAPGTSKDNEWGYTTATNPNDLLARIERLVDAIVEGGHCCGFVWTQLTDIEQETNGLYSFNRIEKLDSRKVKAVMDAARRKYFDRFQWKTMY